MPTPCKRILVQLRHGERYGHHAPSVRQIRADIGDRDQHSSLMRSQDADSILAGLHRRQRRNNQCDRGLSDTIPGRNSHSWKLSPMPKTLFLLMSLCCAPVYATFGSATAWDIQTTGSDNNGGAFDPGVGSPGTNESMGSGTAVSITLATGTTGTSSPAF